ncbi:antitoxin [Paenibacillus sp. J31TS4]|uniref:hypothetical protein n=1 Tax=Paenibacillus sp. J31TS4 TaxID=2807195 RepID=UPI001B0A351A|nr:hypothetical protein [Paenibacillus sp. J31TS4]GIP37796.1 antitoxin [Paenibacillus sp. J31TS4]
MSYSYRIETIEQQGRRLLVMRLPEELALVEMFLYTDVQSGEGSGPWVLGAIDRVLAGQSAQEEVAGNVCALVIGPEWTTVVDQLAEDEEADCRIETPELKRLLEIWLEEQRKHRQG